MNAIDIFNAGDASLWGLFLSAFVSSTLMPGGSEALLLWMLSSHSYHPLSLLSAATIGNTLGAMTSWWIGYVIMHRFHKQPATKVSTRKAFERVQKYGAPVLFFSWLPLIGDPLCLAAGYLRCNPWHCALFIVVGKVSRYAVLIYIGNFLSQ